MATQDPVRSSLGNGISQVTWGGTTAIANGDTINPDLPSTTEGAIGAVQVTGISAGTVTLAGSEDGTNFVTLVDTAGNDISFTAAGRAEFTTAAAYIKPVETTAAGAVVTVTYRG